MTLSKTTYAYDVTDAYGTQGAVGSNYDPQTWAVRTVSHPGAVEWDDEGAGYLRATLAACVTVADVTDPVVTLTADAGEFSLEVDTPTDTTYSADWVTTADDDAGFLKQPFDLVSGGPDMPRKMAATFSLRGDEFGPGVTDVHGLALIERHDAADTDIKAFERPAVFDESGAIPSDERTAFDALMPCSAYLLKRLIANNANAVGYRTLQVFSFPIVGVGSSL